jgi:hypothetical protein
MAARKREEAEMSWRNRRLPGPVGCLDLHPNSAEIVAVVGRVAELSPRDLVRLANNWRDSRYVALARHRALSPDSPLVVEVLSAFDRVDAIFHRADPADEGTAGDTAVKPQTVSIALKAVRDAVAAAYARPVLRRTEYAALIGPWRRLAD